MADRRTGRKKLGTSTWARVRARSPSCAESYPPMSHFRVAPGHLPPTRSQSALFVKCCPDDEPAEPSAPVLGPGEVGPGVVVWFGVLGLGVGRGEVDGPPLSVPDGLLLDGLLDEPLPDEPLPDMPPPERCADARRDRGTTTRPRSGSSSRSSRWR